MLDEETNGKERQSARSLRHESHCHPKIIVSLFWISLLYIHSPQLTSLSNWRKQYIALGLLNLKKTSKISTHPIEFSNKDKIDVLLIGRLCILHTEIVLNEYLEVRPDNKTKKLSLIYHRSGNA